MKLGRYWPLGWFNLFALFSGLALPSSQVTEPVLHFGRFGELAVHAPAEEARRVVLFVSGDGGWNQGVVAFARELAGLDALVVGIDIRRYLKSLETGQEKCAYPAGDFEALGQ